MCASFARRTRSARWLILRALRRSEPCLARLLFFKKPHKTRKARSPKKAKVMLLGRIDGAVRSGSASPIDELSTRRGRRKCGEFLVPNRIIEKREESLEVFQLQLVADTGLVYSNKPDAHCRLFFSGSRYAIVDVDGRTDGPPILRHSRDHILSCCVPPILAIRIACDSGDLRSSLPGQTPLIALRSVDGSLTNDSSFYPGKTSVATLEWAGSSSPPCGPPCANSRLYWTHYWGSLCSVQ